MNKAAVLLIPVTVLFGLSGCFLLGGGGGTGSTSDPTASSDSGRDLAGGAVGCLVDKDWKLDVDDAATQIGDLLTSNGLTVISSVGTGDQTFHFTADGAATSSTNLNFTITIDAGSGLVMVMDQHHEGTPGGDWAWTGDDSQLVFNNWEGDYTVTTNLTINGQAAPSSVAPPSSGLDGQSMTVSCDGDTLHTQAAGSPYAETWHAAS